MKLQTNLNLSSFINLANSVLHDRYIVPAVATGKSTDDI